MLLLVALLLTIIFLLLFISWMCELMELSYGCWKLEGIILDVYKSLTHLVFFLKSETPDASLLQNSKSQSLQTPGLDSSPFEPREHPAPPL